MYDVLSVSKYIIHYSNKNGMIVSNLRLQKLLYFVQAQFLVSKNKPCFREGIEAWDFGPVVPEAYKEYKAYGSSGIPDFKFYPDSDISDDDCRLIEAIVNACSRFTTARLVEITHKQAPWKDAYSRNSKNIIPNECIKQYFLNS